MPPKKALGQGWPPAPGVPAQTRRAGPAVFTGCPGGRTATSRRPGPLPARHVTRHAPQAARGPSKTKTDAPAGPGRARAGASGRAGRASGARGAGCPDCKRASAPPPPPAPARAPRLGRSGLPGRAPRQPGGGRRAESATLFTARAPSRAGSRPPGNGLRGAGPHPRPPAPRGRRPAGPGALAAARSLARSLGLLAAIKASPRLEGGGSGEEARAACQPPVTTPLLRTAPPEILGGSRASAGSTQPPTHPTPPPGTELFPGRASGRPRIGPASAHARTRGPLPGPHFPPGR